MEQEKSAAAAVLSVYKRNAFCSQKRSSARRRSITKCKIIGG